MEIVKISEAALNKAVSILKSGNVVICPTDTVYGFLADATNKKAVEKIYKIKRRPKAKPLPVFVSGIAMAKELAEIDAKQEKILKKYWPGPYTFVLKNRMDVGRPYYLHGVKGETIALRVPKNTFLLKLIKKMGKPLAQTSVNISTQEPLKSLEDVQIIFGKNRLVNLIIHGGNIKNAKPSKIIDLSYNKTKTLRK